MPTAYSYRRFSTAEQEQGDSLRRQTEPARAYCTKHGLTLDETLVDPGVSGFKGRNVSHGALGRFLALIRLKKVRAGDFLIVENLDRFSRQEPLIALQLFTEIVQAGINLVTLSDGLKFTAETISQNSGLLFAALANMIRANEESKRKSSMISASYSEKRKRAAAGTEILTKKCPGWIEWHNGNFRLITERAKIVKRIVKMAIDGMSATGIAKQLNREFVPTLTVRKPKDTESIVVSPQFTKRGPRNKHIEMKIVPKARTWEFSTVQYMIRSKTLIGEYQPKKMVDGKANAAGIDPIPKYYPAVISDAEFYKMQNVLDTRSKTSKGRTGRKVANIFGRVLVSGHDGGTMVLSQKRADRINLVSANATRGISSYKKSFNYDAFETAFLSWIWEVDLTGLSDQPADDVDELAGKLAETQTKLGKIGESLKSSKDSGRGFDRLLGLLSELEQEETELKKQIETARANRQRPTIDTSDIQELIRSIARAADDDDEERSEAAVTTARTKLKTAIAAVCSQIRIYIYSEKLARLAIAHVKLVDGSDRVFAVRTERNKPTTSQSDTVSIIGYQLPDDDFRKYADAVADDMLAGNPPKLLLTYDLSKSPKFGGKNVAR